MDNYTGDFNDKGTIGKAIDIVITIVIILLLIGLYVFNKVKNYKMTQEVIEENKVEEVGDLPDHSEIKEIDNGVDEEFETRLVNMGFKLDLANEECRNNSRCFTKDDYFLYYKGKNSILYLIKNVSTSSLDNYDSSEDFNLIGKIYEKNPTNNSLKKLINELKDRVGVERVYGIFSYNYEYSGLRVGVSYLSKQLKYSISNRSVNKYYDLSELDTMLYNVKEEDKTKYKIKFYDISMEENKKHFTFKDYIYDHLKTEGKNLCSVEYTDGNYEFESSFCHGGTSDTSYTFKYSMNPNEKVVKIKLNNGYFNDYYNSIIKKDIEYFAKKTKKNYKYTDSIKNELSDFMTSNGTNTTLNISNNFEIIITKSKFDNDSYTIEYKMTNM